MRPELVALRLADPPHRWAKLGFSVRESVVALGGVRVDLGVPGKGIVGWQLAGIDPTSDVDGLPTEVVGHSKFFPYSGKNFECACAHENGAVGIDHVVVTTPDFERTAIALDRAGIPLRRAVTSPRGRMGFRRLGPAILELVAGVGGDPGPARFWGLVVVVTDLDGLAARLGDRLGAIVDAVQPGRRIATLRDTAGLGQAVAFMSPEPG